MGSRYLKSFLVGFLLVANLPSERCMAQEIRLSQYIHTAWRVDEGAFDSTVERIAQTTDGYLWIGTETGLLRFDGVRFVPWELPSKSGILSRFFRVRALAATADGSLWVGANNLMRLKDGKTTSYPQLDIYAHLDAILEDPNGGVWVSSYGSKKHTPLCHFSDHDGKCFTRGEDFPCSQGGPLFRDSRGNLWESCNEKIVTGLPGKFTSIELPRSSEDTGFVNVSSFLEQEDGSMLVGRLRTGKDKGLQVYRNGRWTTYKMQGVDGSTLDVSVLRRLKDGSLLIGTRNKGIFRVREQFVDHFGTQEGLSSDSIYAIFEDREGNLWIVTGEGLDRLRVPKVITFSRREGLTSGTPVVARRDGGIFVGAQGGVDEIRENSVSSVLPRGLPGTVVGALLADHAGRLWINVDRTLVVQEGARLRTVTNRNGSPVGNLYQLIEDGTGEIWAVRLDWTLLHIRGNIATEERIRPPGALVKALGIERDGSLIVTFEDGSILNYKDGVAKTLVPAGGPRLWMPTRLPGGQLLGWADVKGTIAAYQDGKFQELGSKNGLPCDRLNDLFYDKRGTLWFHLACGLIAIDNVELQRVWKDPDAKLSYRRFDGADGFHPGYIDFSPRSAQSLDGRLWFSNVHSLQVIDPQHIPTNLLPPPVHIESIEADRKAYTPQGALRLPRLTRDVEIDYTALSLSAPEKVQFRYRLERHDKDWQDAGTRRAAFYNDLAPGSYRFQVIASNNDGIWNTTGDTLSFVIPPAFYQTIWFKCLLAIAAVCLLWMLYLLRLRKATAEISGRLGERLQERERIARELHDTLLQDFQAIILRFDSVFRRLVSGDPNRIAMDDGLRYADKVLREGRNRIREIRADTKTPQDLSKAFADCGNELSPSRAVTFDVKVTGAQIEIDPIVCDEIYRIGREAIGNAFKHSECSKIEVELAYAPREFQLRVRDDGKGIDPAILSAGGKPGHWGMYNMRERAQKIGATLEVTSQPNGGTTLELKLRLRSFGRNLPSWFPWRSQKT
jgi:signal transduction histidine kinase/ligand-binding sensor domain-containing protein